ncbi:sodium/proline symporter [Pandoraea eparura]|jgi:sodium/proline symporter|uniref:Sodium/proline symporter n=1 Tax=Pandoraea eparura TaxID=2508291 RepID=A0A5E4W733_9BURK|nr:sodium/proline symporter PutP [Pandoraea eparura]VVE19404.1 sodium/proline symporter [Pandoraea eparura]
MSLWNPTAVSFTVYLLLMLVIGWLGYRATHDLSDYILGGRRLGSFVTALSAGASDMSGWLLLGLPGAIYMGGLSGVWIAIGLAIGAWANWHLVAARLRVHTEVCGNALTLPEYLTQRFGDRSHVLRIVTALVILIFFTIYCASGVVAGARLFETMFGLEYRTALWIGAVATIAYVFIGGFLAVSWTDTVQASLMFAALVVTPIAVIALDGSPAAAVDAVTAVHPAHTDWFGDLAPVGVISMLAWGLGYFGQPHILVRFMATRSAAAIPQARRICMTWMVLCLTGAVAVGFFGLAFYSARPDLGAGVAANPETIFMALTTQLFTPWLTGVLLAAILAAVMSTLSCQLLVCASALTEDLYKTFARGPVSQGRLVWIGRAMVLSVAVIAVVLALDPQSRVLGMVSYAWAGFGAAFGPLVLATLLWPRVTRNGALAGIVVGAATVLIWKQFGWFDLYEILPGFVLGSLALIVVSRFDRAPSADVLARYASAEATLREIRQGATGESGSTSAPTAQPSP